ncbi:hypothetical protein [Streptomyces sp. NPDC089795]
MHVDPAQEHTFDRAVLGALVGVGETARGAQEERLHQVPVRPTAGSGRF